MAQRAGIPANKVYMFNGSRQSNNFTANAGGVGSTARVAISDVALKNASLDEVRAVTGHEIGHYVLKHTWWGILFSRSLAILFFWLADRLFPRFARAFGSNAAIGDPRGIPVLMFIVSLLGLLALPLLNTFCTDAGEPGRHVFAADREPARCSFHGAREDRGVSLSAAEQDRGVHFLRSSVGRAASPDRDEVEGSASGAANPMRIRRRPSQRIPRRSP